MTPAEWAAQEDEDEAHRQLVEAKRREAQLLTTSGRVPTGVTRVRYAAAGTDTTRRTFEAGLRKVGTVYRLEDGRRGLLTERTAWFIAYPDEPHWCCRYIYTLVEATDDERQADA